VEYPKPWEKNGRVSLVVSVPKRSVPPENESYMEQTRRLLREDGRSLPVIYAELHVRGADMSYFWLRKFSGGTVKDPSVNKVETLNRYLRGLPLLRNAS
jgi:hypothetical protein